jgi:hypothetical protein
MLTGKEFEKIGDEVEERFEEVVEPEFEAIHDRLDEQAIHLMTIDLQLDAIRFKLNEAGE